MGGENSLMSLSHQTAVGNAIPLKNGNDCRTSTPSLASYFFLINISSCWFMLILHIIKTLSRNMGMVLYEAETEPKLT